MKHAHLLAALSTLLILTVAAPELSHAKEGLIGYVNLQRAITETEDGKKAKAKLEKAFKEKQAKLQEEEKALQALKDQLGEDVDTEDPETRAKILELQKRYLALREQLLKEQQELKRLEGEELAKITKRLRVIIREIGKSGGYIMIMEAQESSILFAKPHLDITNEVIRRYNARHGGGG